LFLGEENLLHASCVGELLSVEEDGLFETYFSASVGRWIFLLP
jgi:hypothetical protein